MDVLEFAHVSKRFGSLPVLRGADFSVPEHGAFGLIGKNGAGKTTAMKLTLGFLKADEGEIRICGEKVAYGGARTNRMIGYLPDVPEFYGFMRPLEYLCFCGRIAGMPGPRARERSRELLNLVGLDGVKRKIHGFSRGMKQRLGIAQALLGEPKLLICDEPTSALDPVGRREILELLTVAAGQTAVLFSTHILSDVERVCDRIAILDGGKIVRQGKLAEIKGRYRHDAVRIRLAGEGGALAESCRRLPFVSDVRAQGDTVTLHLADAARDGARVLEMLAQAQTPVLQYEVLEPTLEDVFLEAVQ